MCEDCLTCEDFNWCFGRLTAEKKEEIRKIMGNADGKIKSN